ncbi:MAG: alpha/beta hydrolase [Acidobacteria bacterium]|nr:alpha/beta hydrolase [Acidobacteriota bacterium]
MWFMRVLRRAPPAWALAWTLSVVFALIASSLPEPRHRLQYIRLENRQGMPFRVVVFSPEPPVFDRAPAAILCQPINNPPEYARLLALELVADGFVVLTFDWRGRAREENRQLLRTGALEVLRQDVASAVRYLRGLPHLDPRHLGIAGHSVGGTLAIEAATADPTIAAVASIGMEADVSPELPHNLLWAVGLYDEFRVLNRMRDFFQASAGTVAMENTTVGDFSRGSARRLGVSPTADHFTELQDRGIHREVRDWFRQAVGLPPAPRRLWRETRALLVVLAWLTALLGALLMLRRVAQNRTWVLRVAAAATLLGVVLLGGARGTYFLAATDATLCLLLFALWGGFLSQRRPEALERGWRFAARVGLSAWASLLLTLVVNNIANYLHEPRYLVSLPEFALRHALDGVYAYLFVYPRPLLFSIYEPQALLPRLWVYALIGAEVLVPGLWLGLVARLARRKPRPEVAYRPLSKVSLAVLLLLLGGLGAVLWLRFQQGFLTGESAWAAFRFLMRFTVLPIFIFTLLWRWTSRKKAGGAS